MPKTTKSGEVVEEELPSTLQRSDEKAQATYAKTHDSALGTYDGDERAANQVAFAALKHTHEKVGDHWEPKSENGPSDDQAATPAPRNRRSTTPTAEGVNARATKAHLVEVAKRLGIKSAAKHRKDELVEEIRKANARETRKAREDGR